MPINIDWTDHALYKRGYAYGIEKTNRTFTINLLKKGMSIEDIAEVLEVSIDYVIQIKNELDKK